MDGFVFTGEPTLVPMSYDCESGTFTFENIVFCSPACAKGWLFRDIHNNTDRLHMFTLYCKNILHLQGPTQMCPDPRFIHEYMADPEHGITIDTFRNTTTHVLATGFRHVSPSIDKTVHLEKVEDEMKDGMTENSFNNTAV